MVNKYFDLSFKTVGAILLAGVAFVVAHTAFSIASVVIEFLPEFLRQLIVISLSYAVSLFCLWKFSEIQGRGLEQNHLLNLKEEVIGACIGSVLDLVLLFVSLMIPTVGTIYFRLHNYGMFPGFMFEYFGNIDTNSAIFIGLLINIPILVVVRSFGFVCGRKNMIRHRENIEALAKENAEGISNSRSGRSWKESVGNSTASRTDFLKNKTRDE